MERTEQFMNKTETNIQNQGALIKNLKTQMGQMAIALSGRAPGALLSNTEVNSKEHVKAITTRSGVQLPEIHVKRLVTNKEMVPSTDEEHVEQTEQTTTMNWFQPEQSQGGEFALTTTNSTQSLPSVH
ncbi:Uncharacterized protein Adt_18229 [Abeliophyllum distichum]|uniref:Uncharacterized protein n=1 Tax=Abeliophyllum distichum TaxID=126358 RepID=A0ABD1TIS6_9LAMI